jgi:hypothetical protein
MPAPTNVSTLRVAPAGQHHARLGTTPSLAETDQRPRPGSRADRMARPLARDVLKGLAEHHGVCVRPLAIRRTDRDTGQSEVIDVPCGARLASKGVSQLVSLVRRL